MTTYRVIIGDRASEDIARNALWWAENHSPEEALRWYDLAFKAIYSLETMPARNGLSRENADFPYEIRDLLFGLGSRPSYRAIFTIQDDVVHVLTVHRNAQDSLHIEDIQLNPDSA